MSKSLIVCCDGTWNDPADHTNISWLKDNVVENDQQLIYYDAGVGTDWYDEKSGGALGLGLSRNVRQAYRFVQEHYAPGDDVYCFGFSRGAFTVRSLCGFMQTVGRVKSKDDVDEAYLFYRLNEPDDDPNVFERLFEPDSAGPIGVRMLGVFDTVGSLGVPFEIEDDHTRLEGGSLFDRARNRLSSWIDVVGDRVRRPIKGFHDTRLGRIVENAYQALAMDERRALFVPTLWTAKAGEAARVTASGERQAVPQTVEQVWFAGVHSDVGGGYADDPSLSAIPLLWMVEKASALGLRFDQAAVDDLRGRSDVLASQHDSMTRNWAKIHAAIHKAPILRPMSNDERRRQNPSGDLFPPVATPEAVHASVRERVGRDVRTLSDEKPPTTHRYQPANLPAEMPVVR